MREHVTVPLESLLGLFQNPLHLIEKRKDKLLDYDDMQYALDHAEESEKIAQLREESLLAKRNYEALNTQLLEELPHFIEAVVNMVYHQPTVLLQAQYSFSESVSGLFPPLLASCSPTQLQADTQIQVQQQHAQQLVTICKELAKLSLVPATLPLNFSIRTDRISAASKGSTSPPGQTMTSPEASPPTQSQEGNPHVEGDPPEGAEDSDDLFEAEEMENELPAVGTRLEVLYDFIGEDGAELSVCAGEVVVLRCAHDRIGCEEWWLVQLETHLKQQGYVPSSYLTPYNPQTTNS